MRGIFGAVALLVVLAIVGVLAMKQLRAVNAPVGASLPPAQGGDVAAAAAISSIPVLKTMAMKTAIRAPQKNAVASIQSGSAS